MNLAIRYAANYRYDATASLSPHVARLLPRQDLFVRSERTEFSTNPGANVQYRQDLFDNLVARCFYPHPVDTLEFRLELDLHLTERNAFDFLLDPHALTLPFAYEEAEARVLAPYLRTAGPQEFPESLRLESVPRPTVDTLLAMNLWLHTNIAYERREEGDAYASEDTLRLGRGSCRDFAVLFADVLRTHGVATRLASGFLWEDDSEEAPRRAENAMHAWVEAYLPGAGWLGFDPTNGVLCDHHYIVTAVGLTPADISPVSGHYYGNQPIASVLDATLTITPY